MATSVYLGGGGGGGTPASPNTSVQFNNSGAFGGDANFEWLASHHSIQVGGAEPSFVSANDGLATALSIVTNGIDAGAGASDQTNYVFADSAGTGSGAQFTFYRSRGTVASPSNIQDGDIIAAHDLYVFVNNAWTLLGLFDELYYTTGGLNFRAFVASNDFSVRPEFRMNWDSGWHFHENGADVEKFAVALNGKVTVYNEIKANAELDLTAASGAGGSGNPGQAVVITAGDGDGAGTGGSVLITAGGSGSGTSGDITLSTSDFIKMTGPTLFPGNGSISIGQTNGNSLILRAYDVDGATYKTFLTLTSANTPDMTIGPAAGATVTLQASTYLSADGSTGATTTVTTGSLVGKTMTFKQGLLVSFA